MSVCGIVVLPDLVVATVDPNSGGCTQDGEDEEEDERTERDTGVSFLACHRSNSRIGVEGRDSDCVGFDDDGLAGGAPRSVSGSCAWS